MKTTNTLTSNHPSLHNIYLDIENYNLYFFLHVHPDFVPTFHSIKIWGK